MSKDKKDKYEVVPSGKEDIINFPTNQSVLKPGVQEHTEIDKTDKGTIHRTVKPLPSGGFNAQVIVVPKTAKKKDLKDDVKELSKNHKMKDIADMTGMSQSYAYKLKNEGKLEKKKKKK